MDPRNEERPLNEAFRLGRETAQALEETGELRANPYSEGALQDAWYDGFAANE